MVSSRDRAAIPFDIERSNCLVYDTLDDDTSRQMYNYTNTKPMFIMLFQIIFTKKAAQTLGKYTCTPCLKNVQIWLAITLTHMNRCGYFLAEMLPIK